MSDETRSLIMAALVLCEHLDGFDLNYCLKEEGEADELVSKVREAIKVCGGPLHSKLNPDGSLR